MTDAQLSQPEKDDPDSGSDHDERASDDKTTQKETLEEPPPAPPRAHVFIVAGLVVAGLLGLGVYNRVQRGAAASETQKATAIFAPTLHVATVRSDNSPIRLTLPGETMAYDTASIFSRATGYVSQRLVDIGSRVTRGQLLLRIAAPDLDAQADQAHAQLGQMKAQLVVAQARLAQAEADSKLAKVTNGRTGTLAAEGWATKQSADNDAANVSAQGANVAASQASVQVAQANVEAQTATLNRLQQLTSFERVAAPFDGVVTARNVDSGDLVTMDAASGQPLFVVQRDDILRVVIDVPQSGAVNLREGLKATISVPELPGQQFDSVISRTAVALSAASRTLRVEADIDNRAHRLNPGLYANVSLAIPRVKPGLIVPSDALVFDAQGMQVMVVKNKIVHLHRVSIYRDFGTTVELLGGIAKGDQVALTPPADLRDGDHVRVASPPASAR